MSTFSADKVMDELTDFQRRTVNHVVTQLYDVGSNRFLVADETGLGKSMVARGVIARAIERLEDESSVKRIDVVYVCANADLAQQNIGRLNVTDDETISFASRLTLLGKHALDLEGRRRSGGKAVNLVSFTPGTSFDMGHSTGMAEERAMLLLALQRCTELTGYRRTAAERLLQGGVRKLETFRSVVFNLESAVGERGIDPSIVRHFKKNVRKGGRSGLLGRFESLVDEMGRKRSVPEALDGERRPLIRDLRAALARASVETLEPDLIILDEFQRFRHLLDLETAAGELAHHLFTYPDAKVLLLSATPYKPYTYAEETEDDHATDFHNTLGFLAAGNDRVDLGRIRADLQSYRERVVSGGDPSSSAEAVRLGLMQLMSRQERPTIPAEVSRAERVRPADRITSEDLLGYVDLHRVAELLSREGDAGLVTAEYWKSAPFFATFCDGYQLGQRIHEGHLINGASAALSRTQHVRRDDLESFLPQDGGNARMRDLVDETVGRGLWKLLWVPPSLPYVEPAGPYADLTDVTKMVVFSSWTATPTAVASLLSYEAERRGAEGTSYTTYTPEGRRTLTTPLSYSISRGRPARMSTLTLFWPMPGFAEATDPLHMVSRSGGQPLSQADALSSALVAIQELRGASPSRAVGAEPADEADLPDTVWRVAFASEHAWPGVEDSEVEALLPSLAGEDAASDDVDETSDPDGLDQHYRLAAQSRRGVSPDVPSETETLLASIALHSPANAAYRALARVLDRGDDVSPGDHFAAAAVIANGLRSLFNRPDVTKLLESQTPDGLPYWQRVLHYCANGNLQSVLDEYLHHLRADQFRAPLDAESVSALAKRAADAMSLRTTTYQAIDVDDVEGHLRFVPRFALRYGGRRQAADDARQPEVRNAFNSPFWPFVLTSTSVGQEGIDFHWWCHSVFHWNTPANPVDFEQREGRVDRYRGHAVRRNVAHRHGRAILTDPGRDPWATAFLKATDYRADYGDFTPSWVYPGPAKVERHVAPFALSSDAEKYQRIKADVALYRLAFGQPRQEDMIELLRRRGLDADPARLAQQRISLAPEESPNDPRIPRGY